MTLSAAKAQVLGFFEKHPRIGAMIIGTVVFLLLVLVLTEISSLSSLIPQPYAIFSSTAIATGAGFLGYRLSDEIFDRFFAKKASLILEPLPLSTDIPLEEFQQINIGWGKSDGTKGQLNAKFVAIRVHAKDGNVLNCKVQLRCTVPTPTVNAQTHERSVTNRLREDGDVNWYSVSARKNMPAIPENWKLNAYFTNSVESIYEGHPKDLLLCYVLGDKYSEVWMCTNIERGIIVALDRNEPHSQTFIAELTFTGEGLAKPLVKRFKLSILDNLSTVQPV